MSVIFRTVERPSDPRVENSPKKYFPQLITLGQTVDLAFIAQKMQDRSSLSIGDIKSTMQNFVEKLKVLKKLFIFAPANEEGAIAQLVEQRTENPCVPGSIPGGTTRKQSIGM